MTFNVGDTVDLSHLNRKVVADASRKSFQENLQEVGTSYKFTDTLKAAKIIPVYAV